MVAAKLPMRLHYTLILEGFQRLTFWYAGLTPPEHGAMDALSGFFQCLRSYFAGGLRGGLRLHFQEGVNRAKELALCLPKNRFAFLALVIFSFSAHRISLLQAFLNNQKRLCEF